MRAGSLSDARVVTILKKYFIPVQMPELCTKDMIPDKRDVALVEKYSEQRIGGGKGSFYGGVAEAMLLPDGTMFQRYAALYTAEWRSVYLREGSRRPADHPKTNQYARAGREHRQGPVTVFLRAAGKTLRRVHGKLPADWQEILAGKAPEVAGVQKASIKEPGDGSTNPMLRIWIRSSMSLYDSLVGAEVLKLEDKDLQSLRSLVTGAPKEGARAELDQKLCRRIGRAMVPRGQVLTVLKDESISCKIGATVDSVVLSEKKALIQGRLHGEFCQQPKTIEEVGRRRNAASRFLSQGKLIGYFTYDVKKKLFTELRIVSKDVEHYRIKPFRPFKRPFSHEVGIELLRPVAH